MSTLTTKEPSALLSEPSGVTQENDLEAMIARLDEKCLELKKLLRAQEPALPEEMPETGQREPMPAGKGTQENAHVKWQSLLTGDETKFRALPEKASTTRQRPEKFGEADGIRERLARTEKQRFTLIIYAVVSTLLIFFLMLSSHFLQASYASSNKGLDQPAATIGITNSGTVKASAPETPALAISGVPNSQKLPAVTNTPQEPVLPQAVYVGSRTSNKYHYRSCKWVKYIKPKKVLVFHSVAEAHKAGYIRCPTCQPPLTDQPQTSAR